MGQPPDDPLRDVILHQFEIRYETHISGLLLLESRSVMPIPKRRASTTRRSESLSATATMDFRTYFALTILAQPSSQMVPAIVRKSDSLVNTLGHHSETEIVRAVVDSITEAFENGLLFRNPEFDQWRFGKKLFKEKIQFYVKNRDAVRFCLPAFPCKSSNNDKVASVEPDGAEFEALITLHKFAMTVKDIYPPGCVVDIVSDGHVFSDCVGTDDATVSAYTQKLQAMAADVRAQLFRTTRKRHDDLVTFHGLHEILFPTKWTKKFFDPGFARVEEVGHPVNTIRTLQDDANRGLLLRSCSACHMDLEQVIREDPESSLTLLYRGFSRFMLDDLKCHPDGLNKSKSQRKKLSEKVAVEMMRRNQAYSHLVELAMPRHVRLSIHAHNNSGPKFAISLLPNDRFQHLASFDGLRVSNRIVNFEASHHLHIPTPWHNTLVQINGDDEAYICKSALVKAELEREDSTWLAKSGYIEDHPRGGRYVLYRSETTPRPSPKGLRSVVETEDLYG